MMNTIISFLGKIDPLITTATLVVALAAAFIIPGKIMSNQIFADLVKEYRSCEMGGAILSIFHFYKHDCGKNIENIGDKCTIPGEYRKKYGKQIGDKLGDKKQANSSPGDKEPIDYAHTLHFQRRLIAQFYSNLAYHHYKRCIFTRITKKQLKYWFTPNEVQLLAIILHMVKPAKDTFEEAGDVSGLPEKLKNYEKDVPMNKLLHDLYKDSKQWMKSKRNKNSTNCAIEGVKETEIIQTHR
jgi:hypothetical protein